MVNKVKISKNNNNNSCLVQAISIQKKDEILYVPSPFGKETMHFESIEDAIDSIKRCGYDFCIVDSNRIEDKDSQKINNPSIDYDEIIDVLISNLGHENLEIRNSAISSLSKFGIVISDKLCEILQNEKYWLAQQSIIKCIEKIIANDKNSISVFLSSLINISKSDNTMVKSAALKAIEKICDYKNE